MGSLVVLLFCDTIPSIGVKRLWLECGGYFYNSPPKDGMASRNKARLLRMTLKGGRYWPFTILNLEEYVNQDRMNFRDSENGD